MYDSDDVKSSTRDSDARSKTATDLGVLAQAAGAVTFTALADKRRSSMQYPYTKRSKSHPIPRPTATSTTSHSILVVDYRATEHANPVRTARAPVMEPSGAHHRPSATRRTAARPSPQQTRGKPTSYKSMDSRRSQRRHRSSPH
jgi:hypothetical protein